MSDIIEFEEKIPKFISVNFGSDDLSVLNRAAGYHLRQLQPLKDELIEEARTGKQVLYALDFQELFAYMSPQSDQSQNAILIRYFLENSDRDFILPDGTIYELSLHLSRLASQLNFEKLSELASIDPSSSDSAKQIHALIGDLGVDSLFEETESSAPLHQVVNSLTLHYKAVKRLIDFLTNKSFVTTNQLFSDSKADPVDHETFTIANKVLSSVRPHTPESNLADAINIATVVSIRKQFSHKYFAYLVTHTPTLLKRAVWTKHTGTDPLEISDLLKSSVEVFYATVVGQAGQFDARRQIPFVKSAVQSCVSLQDRITNIPGFLENQQSPRSNRIEENIWDFENQQKALLLEEMEKLNEYFVQPMMQTIEHYLSLNLLRNVNLLKITGRDDDEGQSEAFEVMQQASQLHGLLQVALDICKASVGDEPRHVDGETQQRTYPALNIFSIQRKEYVKSTSGTKHFRMLTHDQRLIIALEQYVAGFYSLYWSALITIEEFVDHLNKLFDHLSKKYPDIKIVEPIDGGQNIEQQGILIQTEDESITLPLALPLSLENVLQDISYISFIRVNTLLGDFYLDVLDTMEYNVPRFGAMSHLDIVEELIFIFSETTYRYFWPRMLETEIKQSLQHYPKPSDEQR